MNAIIGANVKVEVAATYGSPLTVTVLTKANPGVVTSTAHGLNNGAVVVFTMTDGMVELDKQAVRIANKTTDTFELEGLDTTNYSTFTAGTCVNVATWSTMSAAQQITMPNPAPAKIDITVLLDKVKHYTYGLPDAPDGSINGLFNPGGGAEGYIKAATAANAALAFRVSFAGGQHTIFNANVSGGSGFDLQENAAAKATVAFTPLAYVQHYPD